MTEDELFELVRENYYKVNRGYLKEQVRKALSEPHLSAQETLDGLLDWIVEAGCAGLNEKYRLYVYSAIGYLSERVN